MKLQAILIASLCPLFALGQDSVALPSDTLDLVAKLQEFEAAETAKHEAVVAEKRQAVANALKRHLERETKVGKLEVALAIKNLAQDLEQNTLSLKFAPRTMTGRRRSFRCYSASSSASSCSGIRAA